jgi:hypothetical protein
VIEHLHPLVPEQPCGVHQILVNRYAALVIQVEARDARAMNL